MVKLPTEVVETIWNLKRQLLDIVDEAKAAEFILLERFGETDRTIIALDELQDIAEQAADRFSQLSNLQLRVAQSQPTVAPDMLRLLTEETTTIQNRVPALERSIEEIKLDWSLP
ncbi:MAG: hypothetical protein AB4426_34310 [Xenococcaceae cyanobacterium]